MTFRAPSPGTDCRRCPLVPRIVTDAPGARGSRVEEASSGQAAINFAAVRP